MMGTSGLLSSVAAAVSLMIASIVTMLVLSSMVAFHGWPSVGDVRDTRGSVAIASVDSDHTRARQRVVLGGEPSRPAARRSTRRKQSQRSGGAHAGPRAVTAVGENTGRGRSRVPQPPTGEVLGVSVSGGSEPEEAPTPPTDARAESDDPVAQIVDGVTGVADGMLGDPAGNDTPVADLIDALHPATP